MPLLPHLHLLIHALEIDYLLRVQRLSLSSIPVSMLAFLSCLHTICNMEYVCYFLFRVHRVLMQKRVNNSPTWIHLRLNDWRVKGFMIKCEHFTALCVNRKVTLPLWHKQPIVSPFSWIKQTLDWTQRSSVVFMDGLCPLQICDTEPWQGDRAWLWLQPNLIL